MSMAESQLHYNGQSYRLFVVMGVAGCGKSVVGQALADALDASYLDGDNFHPAANIAKMSAGDPLNDDDRWPWLDIVGRELAKQRGMRFVGCSALKKAYRRRLADAAGEPVLFIYLDGSQDLISSRMQKRTGHFMPTTLLDSQFAALEIPESGEPTITLDVEPPVTEIVSAFLDRTRLT